MTQGSLVYQLAALKRVPAVIIPCRDVNRTMRTISAHFLRSPELQGIKYDQRALYCVQPGRRDVIHAVMVQLSDGEQS